LDRGVNLKKIFGSALFILLLAVMSACSNEEPTDQQTTAPATEQTEQADKKESAPAVEDEAKEETVPTTEDKAKEETVPTTEDKAKEGTAPTTEDKAAEEKTSTVAGDEVFQTSCITCHSSGDLTQNFETEEELLGFVSENMPKSAPGSLSEEEYDAVVKYLWDQK
jgi:mono/diheme cytochrome c family protein